METDNYNLSNTINSQGEVSQAITSESVSNSLPPPDFIKELTSLINKYSIENESNTPDYILAEYLITCLQNYEQIIRAREKWFNSEINFTSLGIVD